MPRVSCSTWTCCTSVRRRATWRRCDTAASLLRHAVRHTPSPQPPPCSVAPTAPERPRTSLEREPRRHAAFPGSLRGFRILWRGCGGALQLFGAESALPRPVPRRRRQPLVGKLFDGALPAGRHDEPRGAQQPAQDGGGEIRQGGHAEPGARQRVCRLRLPPVTSSGPPVTSSGPPVASSGTPSALGCLAAAVAADQMGSCAHAHICAPRVLRCRRGASTWSRRVAVSSLP